VRLRIALLVGLLLLASALVISAQDPAADQTIKVSETVNPGQINLRGTGSPDQTTVTLTLTGPAISGNPLDVMLVLDRSASEDLLTVQAIGQAFVQHLSDQDQVSIVSFADFARLELGLTKDKQKASQIIASLTSGNQSALGDGLATALDELAREGRIVATKIIVLATDGVSTVGQDPRVQIKRAVDAKVPIFVFGVTSNLRESFLGDMAHQTGGIAFSSYSDEALKAILHRYDHNVAASSILISKMLPSYLRFESAAPNPPEVDPGFNVTNLVWRIPFLMQGETWTTSFKVSAGLIGAKLPIDQPSSTISYKDAQGNAISQDLPVPTIDVAQGPIAPPPQPQPPQQPQQPQQPPPPTQEPQQPQSPSQAANLPPIAALKCTPDKPLIGEVVACDGSGSKDPDGKIVKYQWDWNNDGKYEAETTEAITYHAFAPEGPRTIILQVSDDKGATAKAMASVTVVAGLPSGAAASGTFSSNPKYPDWLNFYIGDGVFSDEEARDCAARYAADIYIPGTQYRLAPQDAATCVLLNQVTRFMVLYKDPKDAQAAGYIPMGPFISKVGQSYVNPAFVLKPLAPDRPMVLLYDKDASGTLQIAGVRYISTDPDSSLFETTSWPASKAACQFADGSEQAQDDAEKCPAKNDKGSVLALWHPSIYGLTIWAGIINPNGFFASLNPQVTGP